MANEIVTGIEHWLKEHENKLWYAHLKKVDLLRLLKLRIWCDRHCVDLDELLSLVLPYLRKSITTKQKSHFGLGVSIATLTGNTAETILVEALRQKYQGKEHIVIWRERERQRQLDAEAREETEGLAMRQPRIGGILEAASAQDFLQSYRRRVMAARDKERAAYNDARRRKKRYRGNPWL